MQIENPDALKTWLTHILEPLCDADPAALARYVLALLKKDKAVRELSQCMSEQLDVFLGAETAPFLARLFDSIASEEYLQHQPTTTTTTATASAIDGVDADAAADAIAPTVTAVPVSSSSSLVLSSSAALSGAEPTVVGGAAAASAATASLSMLLDTTAGAAAAGELAQQPGESAVPNHDLLIEHASPINSPVRSPTKGGLGASNNSSSGNISSNHHTKSSTSASNNNNNSNSSSSNADNRRRRISARSRSRSRSRSFDRTRGGGGHRGDKASTIGSGGGRHYGGSGRNKSPAGRAYDRRGGGGGGGGGGNNRSWKSRSRSPIERRSSKQQQQHQQRSLSPYGDAAATAAGLDGGAAKSSGNSGSSNNKSSHQQPHGQQQQQRQRCRDFDEKGYCMRGETCPWDHGVNPVVLEDVSNPALMSAVPHGRGAEYNPDAPDIWTRSSSSQFGRSGAGGPNVGGGGGGPPHRGGPPLGGYQRGGGQATAGGGQHNAFRGGPPASGGNQFAFALNASNATTPLQRELISVPVQEAQSIGGSVGGGAHAAHGLGVMGHGGDISAPGHPKRRYDPEDTVAVAEGGIGPGPLKRKLPISGRLGPRVPSMQQNCSLELRKVPRGLNSIAHLNNHFSKFGKIVNIQISYDGDAEAAIVTFSTHAEANVAYRSTEAVLNNRFIKVFWHSAEASKADGQQMDGQGLGLGGGQQQQQQMQQQQQQPPHLRHKGGPNQYSLNNTTNNNHHSNNGGHHHHQSNAGATAAGAANNNGHSIVPAVPTSGATTDAKSAAPATPTTDTAAAAAVGQTAANHAASSTNDAVKRSRINRINPALAANNDQLRRKHEDNAKAAIQLAHGLQERKRELLEGYLKQMRTALELVERTDITEAKRLKLLETIKTVQESIDKLHKEITDGKARMQPHHVQVQMAHQQQAMGAAAAAAAMRRTKEQHKKELLDIELELFAQQQEGNDCTQLQKRIEELQRKMSGSGAVTPALGGAQGAAAMQHHHQQQQSHHQQQQHHHHQQQQQQQSHHPHFAQGNGGGVRGPRVRPAPPGSTSVDRRPTTLRVLGFKAEDSDVLLGHFKHFGEVTRNELDKADGPSLVIAFATRINAEQAMLRGRTFKDAQLQISWVSNPCVPPAAKKPHLDITIIGVDGVAETTADRKTTTTNNSSSNSSSAVVVLDDHDVIAVANDDDDDDDDVKIVDAVHLLSKEETTTTTLSSLDGTGSNLSADAVSASEAATEAAAAAANSEEVLLPLEDEEEEDDGDEDRSWRR